MTGVPCRGTQFAQKFRLVHALPPDLPPRDDLAMPQTTQNVANSLPGWTFGIDELFVRTNSFDDRAAEIARLLRRRFPTAALAACRLDNEDAPSFAGGAPRGRDREFLTPRRLVTRSGEWRPRKGLWLKD